MRAQTELADIFRKHRNGLGILTPDKHKVINAVVNCRTKVLGGHALACNQCDYKKNAYNSCRNRHCPKCQFLTKVKWIEKRRQELLPCSYFHVVFTIPQELRSVFRQNQRLCYDLLFKATSGTLKEVANNPKNFGAQIGFIGILHTWAQNLVYHPHIHYVVPAGGLNSKNKWIKGRSDYFLPVKILGIVFRAKLLKALKEVYNQDKLEFFGKLEHLKQPAMFDELLYQVSAKNWHTYSKKPFAGAKQVISYLGQYTHRIAISNYRIVEMKDDKVVFKVRDNDNPGKSKLTTLTAAEFLRRFLQHVLPKGYMRIRHFGILGNRYKKEKIKLIRKLNNIIEALDSMSDLHWQEVLLKYLNFDVTICPSCSCGTLEAVEQMENELNTS